MRDGGGKTFELRPGLFDGRTTMCVDASVQVKLSSPSDWVKLNLGQHAPLRVLYPADMLARLAEGVKAKTLPPTDR